MAPRLAFNPFIYHKHRAHIPLSLSAVNRRANLKRRSAKYNSDTQPFLAMLVSLFQEGVVPVKKKEAASETSLCDKTARLQSSPPMSSQPPSPARPKPQWREVRTDSDRCWSNCQVSCPFSIARTASRYIRGGHVYIWYQRRNIRQITSQRGFPLRLPLLPTATQDLTDHLPPVGNVCAKGGWSVRGGGGGQGCEGGYKDRGRRDSAFLPRPPSEHEG